MVHSEIGARAWLGAGAVCRIAALWTRLPDPQGLGACLAPHCPGGTSALGYATQGGLVCVADTYQAAEKQWLGLRRLL